MQINPVKQKTANGGVSIGTMMFEFNTTGIGRIAANAGAEFAVYDMEHTGWDIESIRMLIATTPKPTLVPIVRIPTTQYHFVSRVLDMGAMGIMAPMVESAEEARLLVQSAKYPPLGRRGAAFGIPHDDYGIGTIPEIVRSANAEVLLIVQVETAKGLKNLEEIAAVPEVDVLWIGLYDMASSMGLAGQMDHPDLHAAIDRVLAACQKFNKVPAVLVTSVEEGQAQLKRGFRLVAFGGDVWIYQTALKQGLAALRNR
ncbi:HpcH/HpaI aldolase family protein [Schlesneria paludicola]|uniref:HpcH/HpaI aldolase family protein n=1 Tax=Schlesneria paludicola TaxID=360056 RepID=UPI00029B1FB2|nr:aldolase/citrate lyase family protein [Schlesneria paludicola]